MHHWLKDPRHYQIITLTALLTYGIGVIQFDISLFIIGAILLTSLLTQFLFSYFLKHAYDIRSPLITALSLCLLLRTNMVWVALLAAIIAISSKYVIRIRNKHMFNPANIGIVFAILITNNAWISPSQWGSTAWFAFLMACLGGLVINKASRSDISLVFLTSYAALLLGRALWLGDPISIPLHQLQSGALLLFTFFMISDPKTTPDSRMGRILFAITTACLAYTIQYIFYIPLGILYALTIMSVVTPLMDKYMPAPRYQWQTNT